MCKTIGLIPIPSTENKGYFWSQIVTIIVERIMKNFKFRQKSILIKYPNGDVSKVLVTTLAHLQWKKIMSRGWRRLGNWSKCKILNKSNFSVINFDNLVVARIHIFSWHLLLMHSIYVLLFVCASKRFFDFVCLHKYCNINCG